MILLTSKFECKIDAKGRLVLPSKLKSNLPEDADNELVLRNAANNCLNLYPMVEFRKLYQKFAGLNEFDPEQQKLQGYFFSNVQAVELDGAGRILIPKFMIEHAGLERDAIVVGTGQRIEIWNPERHAQLFRMDPSEASRLEQKYMIDHGLSKP